MTERRDDQGYAVSPARLGGSGSRGPGRGLKLGAIIALTVGVAIVGIGWLGPRLSQPPRFDAAFFATPVPETTPTPPTPTPLLPAGPTPLPALTRTDGAALTGRLGVWTNGFHVLDLESGSVSPGGVGGVMTDAILPSADGGWSCVCMDDRPLPNQRTERRIRLVRIAADGSELSSAPLATFVADQDAENPAGVQTDVALAPDGRSAVLLVATLTAGRWDLAASRIDLGAGTLGPSIPIGQIELPAPPAGKPQASEPEATAGVFHRGIGGPWLRRSPDGSRAIVLATLYQGFDQGPLSTTDYGWSLTIAPDGSPTVAAPADGLAELPADCTSAGFVRDDRFAAVCLVYPPGVGPDGTAGWFIFEFTPDGARVSDFRLPDSENWYAEPLFDTANGLIWLWDPAGLTLHRFELDGGRVTSVRFDARFERQPGTHDFADRPAAWARPRSSVTQFGQAGMAGAPDGSRLYLLGLQTHQDGLNPSALGIFVVSPRTMGVLDRWAPDAMYVTIESVLGGRAVAAAGSAGFDANGQNVPWESSLTIHDSTDGKILMRFGQLGEADPVQVVAGP